MKFSVLIAVMVAAASCASAGPITATDAVSVDLSAGLVAHYPLDGNAVAQAGSVDGRAVGTTGQLDRFGTENAALGFGSGAYVEFDDAAALNVAQDFSIAAWLSLGEGIGADWYSLFEKSDPERGGHSRYGLWMHGRRPAACFEAADNSRQPCVESDQELASDGWHHVAAVRSGRRLIIYVDGDEVANGFVGLYPVSQTDFNAFMGTDRYQEPAVWLDGSLDDVRLYSRGLTAEEVDALASDT